MGKDEWSRDQGGGEKKRTGHDANVLHLQQGGLQHIRLVGARVGAGAEAGIDAVDTVAGLEVSLQGVDAGLHGSLGGRGGVDVNARAMAHDSAQLADSQVLTRKLDGGWRSGGGMLVVERRVVSQQPEHAARVGSVGVSPGRL